MTCLYLAVFKQIHDMYSVTSGNKYYNLGGWHLILLVPGRLFR